LPLLSKSDYREYPHQRFGIPKEDEIESVVRNGEMGLKQIMRHFVDKRHGKQGIKEIVQEVLQRKTRKNEEGKITWVTDLPKP
jgi:3-hydroxyisobutyryl-CoA hydrolase